MKKLCVVILLAMFSVSGHAQVFDTLFTVRQELPLPSNDSGGRWLPSGMMITSVSAYPQHFQIFTYGIFTDYGTLTVDTAWKLKDTAYYLADSIEFITSSGTVKSDTPWKYIGLKNLNGLKLDFFLPAYGSLHIPLQIQSIIQLGTEGDTGRAGDTVSHAMYINSHSDSAGRTRFSSVVGQVRCLTMFPGVLGTWQESIPVNDSGGRWLPTAALIKSAAPYDERVYMDVSDAKYNSIRHYEDTFCVLADSAFYLADTIFFTSQSGGWFSSVPSKYVDSIHNFPNHFNNFRAYLSFRLPAHATIRVPLLIRAKGNGGIQSYNVSAGYYDNKGVEYAHYFRLECPITCSGPYVGFNGSPINNKANPAVMGQAAAGIKGIPLNGVDFPTTHATYKMIGEYSDRFTFPDTLFDNWTFDYDLTTTLTFKGAPKSPLHDTLVATFTDCLGSITTRTPVDAYTVYQNGYNVRSQYLSLLAPFLGRAEGDAAMVINTSDFPITVRDLHADYHGIDFDASAPAMIPAHDSTAVHVIFRDRDVYQDTVNPRRSTTIHGTIVPYQQELGFKDSSFAVDVDGTANVYCPYYVSNPPKLKSGITPAGIVFTSAVSSSLRGPGTFLTAFGNYDSVAEYFEMPLYGDPHFKLEVGTISGGSPVALPGYVQPRSGLFDGMIPIWTIFSGDSHQNYLTQLHWPREHDTITIDVLALGTDAPQFLKVAQHENSSLALWPNPAFDRITISASDQPLQLVITDALGRHIRTIRIQDGETLDVSNLPSGMYEFYFPSLVERRMVQIVR